MHQSLSSRFDIAIPRNVMHRPVYITPLVLPLPSVKLTMAMIPNRRPVSKYKIKLILFSFILFQHPVQQKANKEGNHGSARAQQELLIGPLSDLLILLQLIQPLSFHEGHDLLISVDIIGF